MNRLIFFLLLSFLAIRSQAQNHVEFDANYNINFPSGSAFRNLVSHPAYSGFTAGFSYAFDSCLRVGLSIGYNDYYQKYPRQVYSNGPGSDVSAVVTNSIQQAPLLATIDYTFLKYAVIRPYVGGGAGVNFINLDQYLGEFDNPVHETRFALRGEAGILISLSNYSATAIRIGGSYNYAPFKKYGISNLNNWGIHAGITLPIH
ncbi:MAG TPA: hypothetical protein VG605_07140 [Puia sp.]|nr:hypothetical protein [Puia sp.]